jgi:hypothetical protein
VLVLRHLTMRCWSQRRTAAHLKPIPTETAVKRVSVLDGLGRGGKRRDVTSATTYAGGTRPVQVARSRRKRSPHRRSGNGELAERHRDKGKARREIVSGASNQPHAGIVAFCHNAEAVMLDFVPEPLRLLLPAGCRACLPFPR